MDFEFKFFVCISFFNKCFYVIQCFMIKLWVEYRVSKSRLKKREMQQAKSTEILNSQISVK